MYLGIDIVENERISQAIKRSGQKFIDIILSAEEQRENINSTIEHYAGIWAAKEAAVKALGTGFNLGISFHDIHIIYDQLGRPHYHFSGIFLDMMQKQKIIHSTLSISHCRTHAIAAALLSR